MDFSSKSPKKEFSKDIASKIDTPRYHDKSLKNHIDKPKQKPNTKAKNKIERPKIDFKRESRNKIQREKINPLTPSRNKIERPKYDPKAPTRNKIEPRKIDPKTEPKHKLQPRVIDPKTPPRNKIEPRKIKLQNETKNKILPYRSHTPVDKIKNKPSETGIKNKNLMNSKVQNTFKEYHNEMGKYPNYGRNLKKDFIKWVVENNPEISEKIKEIQNNQEILKFLKDKIKNTNETQYKLKKITEDIGIHVSHGTIKKISLEQVYNNDLEKYEKRFLSKKYKGKSIEKKKIIEQRIRVESKKKNPDSLYKISREFPDVSKDTIIKIAKEIINPELYKKLWPPSVREVPFEIKQQIIRILNKEIKKETPRSIKKISDEFDVSESHIQNVAKKLYPNQYKIKWPAIQKIPLEVKQEIIQNIKDETKKVTPRTLKEIHKSFPNVSSSTIKDLAKKAVPKEIHEKIWSPIIKKNPEYIRIRIEGCLKKEILKSNPRSFAKIASNFKVSREYVRTLARRNIPQSVYKQKWEPIIKKLSEGKKKEIIRYILNTNKNLHEIADKLGVNRKTVSRISQKIVFQDDIRAHQIRFPKDIDKEIGTFTHKNINLILTNVIDNNSNSRYYSEPKIFPDLRSSDGIIPEYNHFLEERLKNSINGRDLMEALGISQRDIKNIKATQFDFTNDLCEENILNKIEKYQSPGTLFLIVGTKWISYSDVKELPTNDIIKYPKNIKIISHELFADLIGISGKDRVLFNNIIDLNNNKDLEALKILYNYDLSSNNTYNGNQLKEELIQKGLIKKKFSEFFNFDVLNKKDDEEKQLDLGHFLNL